MRFSLRTFLPWICISLWLPGCAEERPSFDVTLHRVSGGVEQFVSNVIDLGENREVYRWGTLALEMRVKEGEKVLETEYCLTNNATPKVGNYFTYTFSPDRSGYFVDYNSRYVDQRVVMSHDERGLERAGPSFNWSGNWASAKYHVLFDFKQVFAFTRVEVSVGSYYVNQYLPHVIVYVGDGPDQNLKMAGEGYFPKDAQKKFEKREAYGGNYDISIPLDVSVVRARFLKVVCDKPQMGIEQVLVPSLRVWGKLSDLSQLFRIQVKAVSAPRGEDIQGSPEGLFTGTTWFDYGQPIPCPENRFVRFLVRIEPMYGVVFPVEGITGKLTPVLL